ALALQSANQREELAGLGFCQGSSGFVEYENAWVAYDRLCDFDHLALGARQAAYPYMSRDIKTEPLEVCRGPFVHGPLFQQTGPAEEFIGQEEVLFHGKVRCQAEFLVYDGNTGLAGFLDRA